MPEWIASSFRNASLLWWLPLALLPLVIHLLNRLRRKSVEWGAMQFLLTSHAARNKRILLEEMALLAVRVLVLAALVSAAARPFIRNPYFGGEGRTRQDVAVVLDASGSMALRQGNMTQFERAVAMAEEVIDALGDGDTVSVILAGPAPRGLSERPEFLSDESRESLKDRLAGLRPTAGGLDMIRALDKAQDMLASGRYAHKQLLVITDGQAEGWRAEEARRWQFLRQAMSEAAVQPKVRVLVVGASTGRVTNAAVAGVELDRRVVGTDRPVGIRVTATNTGTETITDRSVELFVDDRKTADQELGQLQPGASNTLEFSHQFGQAGSHLIRARLTGEDQIDLDDGAYFAVEVYDRLGVLLVDGAPSARPLGSETSYLAAALDPTEVEGEPRIDYLADAKTIELSETETADPSDCRVVVLANVARLGERFLGRLTQFVRDGGGLLITPGDLVDVDWYNARLYADGEGLLPCQLGQPVGDAVKRDAGQTLAAGASEHAAVRLSADREKTDIAKVQAFRWFKLTVPDEATGRVVLRLANGDPFLAEKRVGQGHVLMMATPLDVDWTNLPATKVYVVLAHEMVYWLSRPTLSQWNTDPGKPMVARFGTAHALAEAKVTDPAGKTIDVAGQLDGASMVYRYDQTETPGVYRLTLSAGQKDRSYYFTSRPTSKESALDPLSDRMRQGLADRIGAQFANDMETFRQHLQIDRAGTEIWQLLVAVVLVLLMAEVFLTRRIAAVRHGQLVDGVAFG